MADKIPDPSADCPRCHYWEQRAAAEAPRRNLNNDWPLGIDQTKALDILTRAFPRAYGARPE